MEKIIPMIPYSHFVIHVIGAADVEPFDKNNVYSTEIVELFAKDETKFYRILLRVKNNENEATVLYGNWTDREKVEKISERLLKSFKEYQSKDWVK